MILFEGFMIHLHLLSRGDLDKVADVHTLVFTESVLTLLGHETVRRYYHSILEGPHDSRCIGAFEENELIGFCFAGVFRAAEQHFVTKNFPHIFKHFLIHPKLFAAVLSRKFGDIILVTRGLFPKLIRQRNGPDIPVIEKFGILSIAVHPKYQRKGIGCLLMNAAEGYALKDGFNALRLSVHSTNYQAISFYERAGWEIVIEDNRKWTGLMVKTLRCPGE